MPTSLQKLASEVCGVEVERGLRATCAEPSLYSRLGGEFFHELCHSFYGRVYADSYLREIFSNTTREAAERNQREYLMQTFGDTSEPYRRRKGCTAIIGRHAPYAVDQDTASRWLHHMRGSLQEVHEKNMCDDDCRQMLDDYFRFMAQYIVEGRKLLNPARTVGYYGKHAQGQV